MRAIPLDPVEYALGLTLSCAVSTTLDIGVSLVRSCMGNEGLALLLTVGTNMLAVVTTPLWLKALFSDGYGEELGTSIDMLDLFIKLFITIAIPSVLGTVLREIIPAVKKFASNWKTALSITATTCLAFIVWQSLSGAQETIVNVAFVNTLYVILLSIAMHLI